jgi:hypothetical protein
VPESAVSEIFGIVLDGVPGLNIPVFPLIVWMWQHVNVFVLNYPTSGIRAVSEISFGKLNFLESTSTGAIDVAEQKLRREIFMVDLNRIKLPDDAAVPRSYPSF